MKSWYDIMVNPPRSPDCAANAHLRPHRSILSLLFGLGMLLHSPVSFAAEVVDVRHDQITVIDGDTLEMNNTVYQLAGIDAPELGQVCNHKGQLWLCGLAAGYRLGKLIELQSIPVKCFIQKRGPALPVAACLIGDSEISDMLLEGGHAVALGGSSPHYSAVEHIAKRGSVGIWGSKFIPPEKWKLGERLPSEREFKGASHPSKEYSGKHLERTIRHIPKSGHAACIVKCVVTDKNERFYYSPLDKEYADLEIDLQRGARNFCSDEEARQASWRRRGEKSEKPTTE